MYHRLSIQPRGEGTKLEEILKAETEYVFLGCSTYCCMLAKFLEEGLPSLSTSIDLALYVDIEAVVCTSASNSIDACDSIHNLKEKRCQ